MPSLPIHEVTVQVDAAPSSSTSPLDLLLERLPRLLALSLTLSSRFEHDPSPHGVAAAFTAMEVELTSVIGNWASEIGNLVAMGLGEMLDKTQSPGLSRRSSGSGDGTGPVGESHDAERLGFGDIVSATP